MACYSYSCYYCRKTKVIEHKKCEQPYVPCDACKRPMVRSLHPRIDDDRNKEIKQASKYS